MYVYVVLSLSQGQLAKDSTEMYEYVPDKCVQTGCTTHGAIMKRMKNNNAPTILFIITAAFKKSAQEQNFAFGDRKTRPKTCFFIYREDNAGLKKKKKSPSAN